MKLRVWLAAAWLSVSGAASCATLADGVDAQFVSSHDTLALKIRNLRKDMPIHIGAVRLTLPDAQDPEHPDTAWRTAANLDIAPGHDVTVQLLPVQQLAHAMQQRGEAPRSGYARILVDNAPSVCSSCLANASYQFKSVGFQAQADASFGGDSSQQASQFSGYLVFLFN